MGLHRVQPVGQHPGQGRHRAGGSRSISSMWCQGCRSSRWLKVKKVDIELVGQGRHEVDESRLTSSRWVMVDIEQMGSRSTSRRWVKFGIEQEGQGRHRAGGLSRHRVGGSRLSWPDVMPYREQLSKRLNKYRWLNESVPQTGNSG